MGKALEHKKRILAAQAAKDRGDTGAETMEGTNAYDQQMVQLTTHIRYLKTLKSTKAKIEKKQEFLPDYDAYIEGVLDADSGVQDDIFMTLLVWMIDIDEFDRAIGMASYALHHGLNLPERFNRDTAALLIEEIADSSLKNDDVSLLQLNGIENITAEADIHDQIRAKLYKAYGQIYEKTDQLEKALASYSTALEFNDKCGVKNIVTKLTKALEKQD